MFRAASIGWLIGKAVAGFTRAVVRLVEGSALSNRVRHGRLEALSMGLTGEPPLLSKPHFALPEPCFDFRVLCPGRSRAVAALSNRCASSTVCALFDPVHDLHKLLLSGTNLDVSTAGGRRLFS